MTRTALYRHFDADGVLLYAGISCDLASRDAAHAAKAVWHAQVHRTETQWCACREHALALERVAIQFEGPKFNIIHAVSDGVVVHFAGKPRLRRHMERIFALLPSLADISKELVVPYPTVAAWKQRGSIPGEYDLDLIEIAARRGSLLTLDDLAQARREKRALAATDEKGAE